MSNETKWTRAQRHRRAFLKKRISLHMGQHYISLERWEEMEAIGTIDPSEVKLLQLHKPLGYNPEEDDA